MSRERRRLYYLPVLVTCHGYLSWLPVTVTDLGHLILGPAKAEIPYRVLTYRQANFIATVTLAQPDAANRVDQGLALELREMCQRVEEQEDIRVVILTGTGTYFSVGREAPPEGLAAGTSEEKSQWLRGLQVASSISSIQVPVLAAINGDALDHGLELALACDIRIAASHARFGLTGLADGVFPWDGGTQRLPRLVGPAWARDMIFTSRVIDAAQALTVGLVNRVVESDRLMGEAMALAEQIAAGGPIAARYAKEAMSQGLDLTIDQGLRLETDLNVLLHSTADRAEGIKSFLERRGPRYSGS